MDSKDAAPAQPRAAPRTASGFRQPSLRRAAAAPSHALDRFEREVVDGRLWHAACQAASGNGIVGAGPGDAAPSIPLSFSSADEYISAFDPLILEEAREGLRSDWSEAVAAGRAWEVKVSG